MQTEPGCLQGADTHMSLVGNRPLSDAVAYVLNEKLFYISKKLLSPNKWTLKRLERRNSPYLANGMGCIQNAICYFFFPNS